MLTAKMKENIDDIFQGSPPYIPGYRKIDIWDDPDGKSPCGWLGRISVSVRLIEERVGIWVESQWLEREYRPWDDSKEPSWEHRSRSICIGRLGKKKKSKALSDVVNYIRETWGVEVWDVPYVHD